MLGACIGQGRFTDSSNWELARYRSDLVGVQEVRWDRGGTVRAGGYNCVYGKGNENNQLGIGFFVHHRIVSAVKRVEFVSDRVSYVVLRGRWCNVIVLKVPASSEMKVPAPSQMKVPAPSQMKVPAPSQMKVPAPSQMNVPAPGQMNVPAPIQMTSDWLRTG